MHIGRAVSHLGRVDTRAAGQVVGHLGHVLLQELALAVHPTLTAVRVCEKYSTSYDSLYLTATYTLVYFRKTT